MYGFNRNELIDNLNLISLMV